MKDSIIINEARGKAVNNLIKIMKSSSKKSRIAIHFTRLNNKSENLQRIIEKR